MNTPHKPRLSPAMRAYLTIWSGQLVSRLGTGMTRFALLVWAYQQTGLATTLALLGFAAFLPYLFIGPLAGVWIDRLDRRKALLGADLGAALLSLGLLGLFWSGGLALWQLYLFEFISGALDAIQGPAHSALTSALLPKTQYGRASGLRSLSEFGAQVLAPALGGLALATLGVAGVLLIDLGSFLIAAVTLLAARLPREARAPATQAPAATALKAGRWLVALRQVGFGFAYLRARPGLLGMLLISALINLFASLTWFSILPALILARSGGDELALAAVQSALGLGGLIGGLVVSVWGGPRRKVRAYLFSILISFLLGDIPLALGRSLAVWAMAAGLGAFFIPFIQSASEALWQSKVAPEVQGRVFTARNALTLAPVPFGYLLGGLLADRVMEPALAVGGVLAARLGWLVGVGPGAGMALMFILSALTAVTACLISYSLPAVRELETRLPDHGGAEEAPAAAD